MNKKMIKNIAFMLIIFLVLFFANAIPKNALAQDFSYTGGYQTFKATVAGNYQLEVWGAKGGSHERGGAGGYSVGEIVLAFNETIYIYVGDNYGWNGGGSSSSIASNGGGASDIRRYGQALGNRILVAGGGGGGTGTGTIGVGGGEVGGDGGGLGGSQSAAGSGGSYGYPGSGAQGGNSSYGGGGGGGGYFGGGSGGHRSNREGDDIYFTGGGGSGYIGGVLLGSMSSGVQSGNGKARVTKVADKLVWEYQYTGTYQTLTVPSTGTYKLETSGAQGGYYPYHGVGGRGGTSTGNVWLVANQKIYLYVGGMGKTPDPVYPYCVGLSGGGFNGGGNTTILNASQGGPPAGTIAGAGGGGASDIRTEVGNLNSRLIVGGGGGGGGSASNNGGEGGGLNGNDSLPVYSWCMWDHLTYIYTGRGGGQSSGGVGADWGYQPVEGTPAGTFGIGSNAPQISYANTGWFNGGGGGGGGWYGGSAGGGGGYFGGGANPAGGGGGSGYIGGVTNGTMSVGDRSGNGFIRVTKLNSLPNAPVITSPTNGQTVMTLTPTITWTFSDSDVGDYQKSYQVVASNNNWATWYYDSGVVTSGSASITLPALLDGTWKVAVRAWDQTGMDTPPWGYGNFTIVSNRLPNAPIITAPTNGQRFASHTPTITWNFSDPDIGDYQKSYQVVGSNDNWATWYFNTGVVQSGSNSITATYLPDGNWQFAVRTWDQTGMDTPPFGYRSFVITGDTIPPTVGNGMDDSIRYTNAPDGTMMRFNTTNGADTGGSGYDATYFWCKKESATNEWFKTQQRGTSWGTNNWYVDIPIQGEGTYLTRAYPRDYAENFNWTSYIDERYVVDRQKPNAPTIMQSRQGFGNTAVLLSLINNGDNGNSGVASMQVSMDGGSWITYAGEWSNGDPWGLLPIDGWHTVSAKTIDNAGNVSETSITTFGTDSTSPILTLTPSTTVPTAGPVIITATASDSSSGVSRIQLPSGVLIYSATTTYTVSVNGTYTFNTWDTAGNQSTRSIVISNINTIPLIPSLGNPAIFDSAEEAAKAGYYPDPDN